ncbi:MAG: exo-alpha-sialidase [Acidobacteria bacterium]|nr:exo-alpha-sialidase [Acidobacteriota bacterium]
MNTRFKRTCCLLVIVALHTGCAVAKPKDKHEDLPSSGAEFDRLNIVGDTIKSGIFDVSLEYDDQGTGWLAYSWIQIPKFVETHLAKSTDNGRTWNFVGILEKSAPGTFEEYGKTVKGAWREETPCLLFDPTDVPARRWKLFTNRYFVAEPYKPLDRRMSDGTINMRTAHSPDATWSAPVCILGKIGDCLMDLSRADPSLANVRMTTEPGTIAAGGRIYLTVDAGSTDSGLGEWENYRVVLLSSGDHGKSWQYVDTLLTAADAKPFGYRVFTGTSLVRTNGQIYLFATPSGAYEGKNQAHDGLMVMKFSDLARGRLVRDKNGTPAVFMRMKPNRTNGGLADFDEQNTHGGILMPQMSLRNLPAVFQTFETRRRVEESR